MTERIQKILASRGVASRRAAEKMIVDGRVRINGVPAVLGQSADAQTDEILLDGRALPSVERSVYIMLNKPRGYVTTLSDEKGRKTAAQLVADCGVRVYPVGRLDMYSEGLLLFSNDGEFAKRMTHPRYGVEKTYLVWATGYTADGFARLCRPVTLDDGYTVCAVRARLLSVQADRAQLEITVRQGRNRQVRRMCEAVGMHVNRLCRIREGKLELGDLPVGKWRYLTDGEVRMLAGSERKNATL